jgi:hypothetical protein
MTSATKSILVKQVKQTPVFDVFVGEGWNHWSRVAWDLKKKRLTHLKGDKLKAGDLKEVYAQVEALLHHLPIKEVTNNGVFTH